MRTLTAPEARRILLGRQGLITPFTDPFDAVRAMVAVQTQYAASLPVAVAARTRRPKPGWDDAALVHGGPLVKSWSVRHTLHTHLREDHALILATIGEHWYGRHVAWMAKHRQFDVPAIESRILAALADGPITRDELHLRVPELKEIPGVGWGLDVAGLAFQRRLCVVGRGASQSFALLEPEETTSSLAALFLRYVGAYGPVTLADFAHWVGFTQQQVKPAVTSVRDQVEVVRIEGMPGERFLLPDPEITTAPLGVRLLAKFDPLILAHRDKTLLLAEKDRPRVFRIAAQVEAPILSQGQVIGTWRLERRTKETLFHVEPFQPLKTRDTAGIEKEAMRMARNLGLPRPSTRSVV